MKNYPIKLIIISLLPVLGLAVYGGKFSKKQEPVAINGNLIIEERHNQINQEPEVGKKQHPMQIEVLRNGTYLGSDFIIEQILPIENNYKKFVVSYLSEGLKIYGLLTIPIGSKPENGFPAIVFIHGYIPPAQYSTTKNYVSYQAVLAKNGFITFKPDLRGHGKSEGEPVNPHFSEKYVVDTLNAISSLSRYKDVDSNRIGYWGHSNGGEIGLRVLLIPSQIKAASLWAGVVGSYEDMLETYNAKIPFLKNAKDPLIDENGLPSTNHEFWSSIDPHYYLKYVSVPVQLQHATGDKSVPVELSITLKKALENEEKSVEYIEYLGDDHNISKNFNKAWQRTIKFFKANLQFLPVGFVFSK